ncbi:MAG TPA: phosphatase PAP2 family protein [Candidatus Xenobia bacterium]
MSLNPGRTPSVSGTTRVAQWMGSSNPRERQEATRVLVAASAAMLALLLFAVVAWMVHSGASTGVDHEVESWFSDHQSPVGHKLATVLSFIGEQLVLVLALLLAILFVTRQAWYPLGGVIVATAGAWFLDSVLKVMMHRPRPSMFADATAAMATSGHAQDWSFPSGHATLSAAFYCFLLLLVWKYLTGPGKATLTAALVVLLLAIDTSRLALDRHYFTDVMAGFLMGFFLAMVVWLGTTLLELRAPAPPPDPFDG